MSDSKVDKRAQQKRAHQWKSIGAFRCDSESDNVTATEDECNTVMNSGVTVARPIPRISRRTQHSAEAVALQVAPGWSCLPYLQLGGGGGASGAVTLGKGAIMFVGRNLISSGAGGAGGVAPEGP